MDGLGSRPELIRSLNVCQKKKEKTQKTGETNRKKVQIRVRVVPDDAYCLQSASTSFSEITCLKMVYHGEGKSGFTNKMLSALFVSRRIHVDKDIRESIKEKQEGLCALCGDKMGQKFEIDHISPLCQNGTNNDTDNLRALCSQCHAED